LVSAGKRRDGLENAARDPRQLLDQLPLKVQRGPPWTDAFQLVRQRSQDGCLAPHREAAQFFVQHLLVSCNERANRGEVVPEHAVLFA
jgi:hypothetical protein